MTTRGRKPAKNKFVTGTIQWIKAGRNSVNGNPSFWVTIDLPNGDVRKYRTMTDAMCAYGIHNSEFRNTLVTLEIEKSQIVHITVAEDNTTSNDTNGAK